MTRSYELGARERVVGVMTKRTAYRIASAMNAAVRPTDGRPARFYAVERGRIGWRIVKYPQGKP